MPEAEPGTYTVTSGSTCRGSTRHAETSFEVDDHVDGNDDALIPPDERPTQGAPPDEPPPDERPTQGAPPDEPPTQGAPPQEQLPGSTLAEYEEFIQRELERGVILYNPPERMRVGAVNRVEVRIGRELTDELSEGLRGVGIPRIEELLVGTQMRATLVGSAFNIVPIGSEVQQLTATGFREWRWDVTPVVPGDQPLFVVVSVLHEETLIDEKVFERRINVVVNPGYSFANWLGKNWEALIAALVGVLALVEAARRLWRRPQQ